MGRVKDQRPAAGRSRIPLPPTPSTRRHWAQGVASERHSRRTLPPPRHTAPSTPRIALRESRSVNACRPSVLRAVEVGCPCNHPGHCAGTPGGGSAPSCCHEEPTYACEQARPRAPARPPAAGRTAARRRRHGVDATRGQTCAPSRRTGRAQDPWRRRCRGTPRQGHALPRRDSDATAPGGLRTGPGLTPGGPVHAGLANAPSPIRREGWVQAEDLIRLDDEVLPAPGFRMSSVDRRAFDDVAVPALQTRSSLEGRATAGLT